MHALPLAIALVAAAALAPSLLRALQEAQHVKPNYRGRLLPFPLGALTPAAARLARSLRGRAAWRAFDGRAQGGGLARPGAVRDELSGALGFALAARKRRARPGDAPLQPARPAPRPGDEGAADPRRGPSDRLSG